MLLQSHSLDGSRLIALCPYAIVVSAAVSSCSSIWITMGRTLTSRTDGTHLGQLKKTFSCCGCPVPTVSMTGD